MMVSDDELDKLRIKVNVAIEQARREIDDFYQLNGKDGILCARFARAKRNRLGQELARLGALLESENPIR